MTTPPSRTRRGLLVGGATGVGGLLAVPLLADSADAAVGRQTHLHGSRFAVVHGDLARPEPGHRALVSGSLGTLSGQPVGTVHAEVTVLRSPSRHDDGPAALETHTLVLPHGTLVGHGVADHAGSGRFAVIGGTGAFSGARGSYQLHQSRIGQGGDGSATFILDLES